jgi:hypothetical protein
MTERAQKHLEMMKDIYTVSTSMGLKTYLWGGYAVDILNGALTREHSDIDGFTENLVENKDELIAGYEALGYSINLEYFDYMSMLIIKKNGEHAAFNPLKNVDGIAHWQHVGAHGTVFFPYEWLDTKPANFYGSQVYTCGAEMAYLIKTNIDLLNPEMQARDKDTADIAVLEQIILAKNIDKKEIRKKIWCHSPYLYAKGYEEYLLPVLFD